MIRHVIFDMGNVLLRFDPEIPLNAFVKTKEDKAIIRKELFQGPEWIQGDYGTITNEQRFEPVSKRVPERLHTELKNCVDKWDICMTPIDGAMAFCEYAKEKGYHLYVLSNADNTFYHYFPRFAEVTYFDGVMVSSDIHMIKPEDRIYAHFLETYGLNAEECLFIDDRAENVEATEKAGINGFVFAGNFDIIIQEFNL